MLGALNLFTWEGRKIVAQMDFHACGFTAQSPMQLHVCVANPYHTPLIVCGGREETACGSVPSSPSFCILWLNRYTQTWNGSLFGGIHCMVISALAALNFLKLRTLILCCNVSYLQILYSFLLGFLKQLELLFSVRFFIYVLCSLTLKT